MTIWQINYRNGRYMEISSEIGIFSAHPSWGLPRRCSALPHDGYRSPRIHRPDPRNAEYHWNITGTPKPKVLNFIAHRLQGTTTRGRRVATPTSRVPWTLDILDCWQCGIHPFHGWFSWILDFHILLMFFIDFHPHILIFIYFSMDFPSALPGLPGLCWRLWTHLADATGVVFGQRHISGGPIIWDPQFWWISPWKSSSHQENGGLKARICPIHVPFQSINHV